MVLCKHYFAYLIQVKNVTQKSFQLYVLVVFLQNFFEPNQHFFQIYESSLKLQRAKTKFSGNPDHNILELYNILVQVRFNTSKTELDIQYSKLGKRVGSRVAERLKTQDLRKLGNIRKISDLGRHKAQCPVSLQKIKLWQQQLKNTQKQVPDLFLSSFTRSLFFSKYFVRDYIFFNGVLLFIKSVLEKIFEKSLIGSVVALHASVFNPTYIAKWETDLAEQNRKAPCAAVEAQSLYTTSVCDGAVDEYS